MSAHVRHFTRLALAACVLAALPACATMDDGPASAGTIHTLNDIAYMEAVEDMATKQGVRVVWVNPPKVVESDD